MSLPGLMPSGMAAQGARPGCPPGFWGKIPARGDFVRAGLTPGFVRAWDGWIGPALAASREALGAAWLPAWLEAPVWRFALGAGACGPDPAVGLWMPSVDRAGRHFPLVLAAVLPGAVAGPAVAGAFLDAAEAAGREALACDLPPEVLAARLDAAADAGEGAEGMIELPAPGVSAWWTEGAPRVPACRLTLAGLPDAATFTAMLDAMGRAAEGRVAEEEG